ncbi:MAG: response regulator transcription factor [Elusimicrobiota bacterium]
MTSPCRILVIDDDEQIQSLIRFCLTSQGYQVFSAVSGREGTHKSQTLLPDLILLDMVLPDINGVEVFRAIQAHQKARWIPVIVMTGLEDSSQVLKTAVLALGAVSLLKKPVAPERLSEAVDCALSIHTQDQRRIHQTGVIKRGPVRVDLKARRVNVKGRTIGKIPPSRYDLLCVMLSRPGAVSKRELMHATGAENKNIIEKAVERLRSDLGPEGESIILTVPGGYQIGT